MSFHFFIGMYQYNFLSKNNEGVFGFLLLEFKLPFLFLSSLFFVSWTIPYVSSFPPFICHPSSSVTFLPAILLSIVSEVFKAICNVITASSSLTRNLGKPCPWVGFLEYLHWQTDISKPKPMSKWEGSKQLSFINIKWK